MIHPNLKLIALTFFIVLLTISCESTKLTTNKTAVTYQKEKMKGGRQKPHQVSLMSRLYPI